VCGESRTHGDNGGNGKTQYGCASGPYPLGGGAAGCTEVAQRRRPLDQSWGMGALISLSGRFRPHRIVRLA
jgi:hypothetical protein